MISLVLQTTVALLLITFAVLALAVVRAMGTAYSPQRAGWLVTAIVFLVYSISYCVQSFMAVLAYLQGPGTTVYDLFFTLSPITNHGRTVLLFTLYLLLGAVLFRVKWTNNAPMLLGISILAVVLGGFLGVAEGPLNVPVHFSTTAIIDTAGIVLLAVLLYFMMTTDRMDRYLWFIYALFGLTTIIGILYLAVLSWGLIPEAWVPPYWQLHLFRLVLDGVAVLLVIRRLRYARQGIEVPGLLTPMRTPRLSFRSN